MNPINKLIEDFRKQNKEDEYKDLKQKILIDINCLINQYEYTEHRKIVNKDKARREIAQRMKEQDKYRFNLLISSVLSEIIRESTTRDKSVGGGPV